MMDDDDVIPMALIMNKPKLKSFSFANSLTSIFKTNNTLKEINFNATASSKPTSCKTEEKETIPKINSSSLSQKLSNTEEKIMKTQTNLKESNPKPSTSTTAAVTIENENKKKRPREEDDDLEENNSNKKNKGSDVVEERDFKLPNFSQVDYKDKKKSFSNDNYRRLNMKTFRQKGKTFQKGAKFKRFKWKKNQIKNGNKAKYGVGVGDDENDQNVNFNLMPDDELPPTDEENENEIIDENSAEGKYAKIQKEAAANQKKSSSPAKIKTVKKIAKAIVKKVTEKKTQKTKAPKKKQQSEESENGEEIGEGDAKKKTKRTPRAVLKKKANLVLCDDDEDEVLEKIEEDNLEHEKKKKSPKNIKKTNKIIDDGEEDAETSKSKIRQFSDKDEEAEENEEPRVKKPPNKRKNKKIDIQVSDGDEDEPAPDPTELKSPKPLYELNTDGSVPEHLPKHAFKMLQKDFGYSNFKPHQEEAIVRIACGLSTIVVLSTGYGKSLIYQFAAKLYARSYPGSLVLVVSPLISLMQDQLHNLSRCLRAAVCDSQMNEKEYKELLEDLSKGKINILFMSPEAIINRKIKDLPRLAFACIDEVHCLSQWSHNFRPSYLQLGQTLLEHYNVKCILGLTATATMDTLNEIKSYFAIEQNNILKDCDLPRNLQVTVSRDSNKDRALVELLKSDAFKPFVDHVIVYCSRRDQTEKIAQLLRMSLKHQNDSNRGFNFEELAQMEYKQPTKKGWGKSKYKTSTKDKEDKDEANIAEAYHAGLTAAQRKRIQNQFIKGKLKVIVATMAFGMGINMANIRAVIHYNMPKAIENYVQEIGRAGRDGLLSRCHVFLETQREDINEIKKYVHMNGYDQKTIKRLLLKLFSFCCNEQEYECKYEDKSELNHMAALTVEELVEYLDVKEETILTLFCYLESLGHIKILQNCYNTCTIRSYKGFSYLNALSKRNSFIAAILKQNASSSGDVDLNQSEIKIDMMRLCDEVKEDFNLVRQKLRKLEWNLDDQGSYKGKSGISIQFENVAFCVRRKCITNESELDVINDFLWERVNNQMLSGYANFKALYKILSENSFRNVDECCYNIEKSTNPSFKTVSSIDNLDEEKTKDLEKENEEEKDRISFNSNNLKKQFNSYFNNQLNINEFTANYEFNYNNKNLDNEFEIKRLISDIQKFIYTYGHEVKLNGIVIARVFHGIASPRFPAEVWGRNRAFWRSHFDFDFETIIKYATEQLINA